jgi:cytochrome c-type biogenesis protein CcmF
VAPVVCFAFCGFVLGTITQEFARGASIRRRNTGSDPFTAVLGMVIRGRRRYGGYVVHAAIVLMFVGFAGQAYQKEVEVKMTAGQEQAFGRYSLRFDRLAHEEDRQKEMITGEITVLENGKVIDRMRPARWFFHKQPESPTTEVAIRRSPAEDLYITLGNYDLGEGSAALKLVINPLVDWIWLGFILLAMGTGIALLPDSVLQPVTVRLPAGSAAAGAPGSGGGGAGGAAALLLVLALSLLTPIAARAAASTSAQIEEDRKWLEANIMCMCGMGSAGCRHVLKDCGAECGHHPKEREKIRQMLDEGKTRDDIKGYFMERYGGQIALASPLDQGVNRLAWALPYGLGVVGAGALAFGAWRFTKKHKSAAGGGEATAPEAASSKAAADPELEDRLEDELSKLDS